MLVVPLGKRGGGGGEFLREKGSRGVGNSLGNLREAAFGSSGEYKGYITPLEPLSLKNPRTLTLEP